MPRPAARLEGGNAMKRLVSVLALVLSLCAFAPNAGAAPYVEVTYNLVTDLMFLNGGGIVADDMAGTMTIRYEATGVNTIVQNGDTRLMSMNATGPIGLITAGISLTGDAAVTIGAATTHGTWGNFDTGRFPAIASASGLRLPGIQGTFGGLANCANTGTGTLCTGLALTPGTGHALGANFSNQILDGYGLAWTPPGTYLQPSNTLTFPNTLGVTTNVPKIILSGNFLGLGVSLSLGNIVGTETSRTFFVPEPNTALLLAGGLVGLAGVTQWTRRKTRKG